MARRGLDVRDQVAVRTTTSPAEAVDARGASPVGMRWKGWRSGLHRPGPRTQVAGLYLIGPQVHPGPGLVGAGMAAAVVAADVGKA
jgi:phytoene dehydrogenase-like protein